MTSSEMCYLARGDAVATSQYPFRGQVIARWRGHRAARRLSRRMGRHRLNELDGRVAGLPSGASGHRDPRCAGDSAEQRDPRHRNRQPADLCTAGAGLNAGHTRTLIRRDRAQLGRPTVDDPPATHPAQHRCTADRANVADHPHRHLA